MWTGTARVHTSARLPQLRQGEAESGGCLSGAGPRLALRTPNHRGQTLPVPILPRASGLLTTSWLFFLLRRGPSLLLLLS